MKGRLLYRKWGTFVDDKSGEVVGYDKVVVAGIDPIGSVYNNSSKYGCLLSEYSIKDSKIDPLSLDGLFGRVVSLDFDQIIGRKNPILVGISEVSDE